MYSTYNNKGWLVNCLQCTVHIITNAGWLTVYSAHIIINAGWLTVYSAHIIINAGMENVYSIQYM